ncbi:hypothetical protein AC623_07275 [Bacillus sp. FJAT-27231]|uniref:hypothetical protein n=1 Tax=Bacillus sp. FJAT-27231 TaxID=1679168 RepID=UPI000670A53E|nr:hypothetical protein [Bacillus sp. FJAT-27231]KMY53799.1 hypothetical protein AC623_07275 [Bacillus sp. FJAT-27231]
MWRKLKFKWSKFITRRDKEKDQLLDEELLKRIVRLSIESRRRHRGEANRMGLKVMKGGKD